MMGDENRQRSGGAPAWDLPRWAAWALVTLGMLAFVLLSTAHHLTHYWAGDSGGSLDAAYFLQRIWQGGEAGPACRTLLVTEQGAGLIVGRHLEPILAAFVPLVQAFPTMEALLLAQIALLAALALPAYGAGRALTHDRLTATALALAWLAGPMAWHLGAEDFRTLTVATLPLAACFWAIAARRPLWVAAFALAAAMCREEVLYFVAAMMPAALWHGRGGRRGVAMAAGLGGIALVWSGVVMGALGGLSTHVETASLPERLLSTLGGSPGAPSGGTIIGARAALAQLWQQLGMGLAATPLAALWAAPVAVNWVGVRVAGGLADAGSHHYLAPAAAALPVVYGAACRHVSGWARRLAGGGLARWVGRGIAAALLVAAAADLPERIPDDAGARLNRVVDPGQWPQAQTGGMWGAVALIPVEAPVVADSGFTAALAARPVVYEAAEFSQADERRRIAGAVSWAVLREGSPWVGVLEGEGFKRVYGDSGIEVFQRPQREAGLLPPLCLGR